MEQVEEIVKVKSPTCDSSWKWKLEKWKRSAAWYSNLESSGKKLRKPSGYRISVSSAVLRQEVHWVKHSIQIRKDNPTHAETADLL